MRTVHSYLNSLINVRTVHNCASCAHSFIKRFDRNFAFLYTGDLKTDLSTLNNSVADPSHFDVDPDPGIFDISKSESSDQYWE